MTVHSRPSARHVAALDGIRGLAILVVLLHHLEGILPDQSPGFHIAKAVMYSGWSGVDLFFVLSGFLITGILLDTKDSENYFSSFYARRVLRIFPLYYAVLTIMVVVAAMLRDPWLNSQMPLRHDQPFYFFYLNNWWILLKDTWHSNIIGHFWSLAVEEQFYLLWPLTVWLIPRKHTGKVCLAGIVGAFALRVYFTHRFGCDPPVSQNTFLRMDSLLTGALCAVIVRSKSASVQSALRKITPVLPYFAIISVCSVFFIEQYVNEGRYLCTFGFSQLAIGYGALVLWAYLRAGGNAIAHRMFRSKPLTTMGKYSYGIYVYHVPILITLGRILGLTGILNGSPDNLLPRLLFIPAVMILSFATAVISYEYFEKRFLQLKDRFKPHYKTQTDDGLTLTLTSAGPGLSQTK